MYRQIKIPFSFNLLIKQQDKVIVLQQEGEREREREREGVRESKLGE
jgi:hypothetical protein